MTTRNIPAELDTMFAAVDERARTSRETYGQGDLSFGVDAQVARGRIGTSAIYTTVAASSFVSPQLAVVTIPAYEFEVGRTYAIVATMRVATPAAGPDSQTFYVTRQPASMSDVVLASVISEHTALISAETDDFDIAWTDIFESSSETIQPVSLTVPSGWGVAARNSSNVATARLTIIDVGRT